MVSGFSGIVNSNLLPRPGADVTSREPPAAIQIYLLTYRPKPLPAGFSFLLYISSVLKNGLNSLLSFRLFMPIPVSFTLTITVISSSFISESSAAILIVELYSENLMALDSRFRRTY